MKGWLSRRQVLLGSAATALGLAAAGAWHTRAVGAKAPPPTIVDPRFTAPVVNPLAIPQYVTPLPLPGQNGWEVITSASPGLKVVETAVEIVGGYSTPVWAYRGAASYTDTFLGPTIIAQRGTPTTALIDYSTLSPQATPHILRRGSNPAQSVIDTTVHGASNGEPQRRFIAHLHGGEGVQPQYDGYPDSWITPSGTQGPTPVPLELVGGKVRHTYPNTQPRGFLWYHDHALGITRLNVYAGLAAAYLINDPGDALDAALAAMPQIPLVIQDRMFYPTGDPGVLRLAYPDAPAPAANWPQGQPSIPVEYFGDVIIVNGKAWPFVAIEPRRYRLRILNGCDSRILRLSLNPSLPFLVLGMEGDHLAGNIAPVPLRELVLGPAERFDVIVDFAQARGKAVTMTNRGAKKPYPKGTPPNPRTDGQVMQFRVGGTAVSDPTPAPGTLVLDGTTVPDPAPATPVRSVLLFEAMDQYDRMVPLLGKVDPASGTGTARLWSDEPPSEQPKQNVPEYWDIYNTTGDTHPIHLHEVLFQVVSRQKFRFRAQMVMVDHAAHTLPPGPHVTGISRQGGSKAPPAWEAGRKDTVLCPPGEITRIKVRFRTLGRFVWHCHILEHEDNEMMLPLTVIAP